MNCDMCNSELENDYYHLHQGLCKKCEQDLIEEYENQKKEDMETYMAIVINGLIR